MSIIFLEMLQVGSLTADEEKEGGGNELHRSSWIVALHWTECVLTAVSQTYNGLNFLLSPLVPSMHEPVC